MVVQTQAVCVTAMSQNELEINNNAVAPISVLIDLSISRKLAAV